MIKRRGFFSVVFAIAIVIAASWQIYRPKETDVYLAALDFVGDSDPIFVSKPSTCNATRGNTPNISADLVSSFLAANGPTAKPISLNAMNAQFTIADSAKVDSYDSAGVSRAVFTNGRRLVFLSRVGYINSHADALFCLDARGSMLIHMRYSNGSWHRVEL